MTGIVEAEPVDDGFIVHQPEDARLVVAGLRLRRDGADLGEAETELQDFLGHLGILVVTGGKPQRIGKGEACDRLRQPRIGRHMAGRHQTGFQRLDRQPVGGFGIEEKQAAAAERLEEIEHQASSGKIWRPSLPRGSGFSQMTAESGSTS